MSKVALVRCSSYDEEKVLAAVRKGIALIGGLEGIAGEGGRLLLKPNMLAADPPERCSTTHPAVFKAVARVMMETGAEVSYGDSPAFHSPKAAASKNGIGKAAEALGIPLADFETGRSVFFNEGVQNKKFTLAAGVMEAETIVSIPKLKTHGFAKMTGSIKNQFGCVPGKLKGEMHVKLPGAYEFARMLVDLNNLVRPSLYIMDGILAMEGNGPRGGTPKAMNVLLFSRDPVALDATVCRMVDLDPELVPTTRYAMETGMGTYLEEEIELLGDPLGEFKSREFDVSRQPIKPFKKRGLMRAVKNLAVPRPCIIEEKCVRCGVCVLMCPVSPKALDWEAGDKSRPPVYDYAKCIRCYCCQELCPESAIKLKKPLARKLVDPLLK